MDVLVFRNVSYVFALFASALIIVVEKLLSLFKLVAISPSVSSIRGAVPIKLLSFWSTKKLNPGSCG